MLEKEGLGKYVDPKVIEKEIAEANDISPAAMNVAASRLAQGQASIYSSAEDIFCDTDSEHMSAL